MALWSSCDGVSQAMVGLFPRHRVSQDLPWPRCRWVSRAQPGLCGTCAQGCRSSGLWAGVWHCCGLVPPSCLAFLACQTATWQRFPSVSDTGSGVTRCQSKQSMTWSCFSGIWDDLLSFTDAQLVPRLITPPHVCTAISAIAHHAQPCALDHGSLDLAHG